MSAPRGDLPTDRGRPGARLRTVPPPLHRPRIRARRPAPGPRPGGSRGSRSRARSRRRFPPHRHSALRLDAGFHRAHAVEHGGLHDRVVLAPCSVTAQGGNLTFWPRFKVTDCDLERWRVETSSLSALPPAPGHWSEGRRGRTGLRESWNGQVEAKQAVQRNHDRRVGQGREDHLQPPTSAPERSDSALRRRQPPAEGPSVALQPVVVEGRQAPVRCRGFSGAHAQVSGALARCGHSSGWRIRKSSRIGWNFPPAPSA